MQIARTKWALSVRNLLLGDGSLTSNFLAFAGIENLWISNYYKLPPGAIHIFPFKRLYCHPDDLFTSKPISPHSLSNITHLELFTGILLRQWDETRSGLAALPHLTHLALNETADVPWFGQILLDTCKSIRALILLHPPTYGYPDFGAVADDPRFVIMWLKESEYMEDWQSGVLAGRDYWACADDFVAQRISGAIPREWQ
jgi:hypothetical protein